MKTKNKINLLIRTLFFVGVFFISVDVKTVNADCYDNCDAAEDYYNCIQFCDSANEDVSSDELRRDFGYKIYNTVADCAASSEYGPGYLPSPDNTYCIPDGTQFDKETCKNSGGTWGRDGACHSAGELTAVTANGNNGDSCTANPDSCKTGCSCQGVDNITGLGICGASTFGKLTNGCEESTPAQSQEEIEAAKQAAAKANAATLAASGNQQAAAKAASDTALAVKSVCASGTAEACAKAQADAVAADQRLREADAALTEALTNAANARAAANPGEETRNSPSGLVMCANGILGSVCRDENGNAIGGTPVSIAQVLGVNNINPGSNTLPGNYNTSSSLTSQGKCGQNFSEIGGVCFPTNTGLSNASISTILANLFSWLMGLFTTLAVVAFVISGIQYVTAAGNEGQMETAKNNATYAIIGIIVGLSGFVIIKAIAAALAGQGYFF